MSKILTKKERDAIVATIKQGKQLADASDLQEAVKWSDKNPKTKPHFLIHSEGGHVIVY